MIVKVGNSRLHKGKFAAIITGLKNKSLNPKTGQIAQMYLIPLPSQSGLRDDDRHIVCGNCPLLSANACYVNQAFGTTAVKKKFAKGLYEKFDLNKLKGLTLRYGADGDPCNLSVTLIRKLNGVLKAWLGYTHQWAKTSIQPYKEFFHASVHTKKDKELANSLGWKTFRVGSDITDILKDEILCPSSTQYKEKSGRNVNCEKCKICCGNSSKVKKNVFIVGHGGQSVKSNIIKLIERDDK